MSVSVRDLLELIRSAGPSGTLGPEEGVLRGSDEAETDGVLVSWMPTVAAIRHAVESDCRVIISHEALTFYNYFPDSRGRHPWSADRARLLLLDGHGIAVVRAHFSIDPTYIVPAFIRAAALSAPVAQGPSRAEVVPLPVVHRRYRIQTVSGRGLRWPRTSHCRPAVERAQP